MEEAIQHGGDGRGVAQQLSPVVDEVVRITPALSRIIMEEGNSIDIAAQARVEGFNDLRASALQKAASGATSLEEVNRITTD